MVHAQMRGFRPSKFHTWYFEIGEIIVLFGNIIFSCIVYLFWAHVTDLLKFVPLLVFPQ